MINLINLYYTILEKLNIGFFWGVFLGRFGLRQKYDGLSYEIIRFRGIISFNL